MSLSAFAQPPLRLPHTPFSPPNADEEPITPPPPTSRPTPPFPFFFFFALAMDLCRPEQTRASMITDITVEVFFLFEICVNFFTSYYDSDNAHITSNKLIALHYLKGWFVIDGARFVHAP